MSALIINGCEQVTVLDVESVTTSAMDQADALAALFRAIDLLSEGRDIKTLCQHGARVAFEISNDADCLRERAVKAGFVGSAA
jgi:hypothetical protein